MSKKQTKSTIWDLPLDTLEQIKELDETLAPTEKVLKKYGNFLGLKDNENSFLVANPKTREVTQQFISEKEAEELEKKGFFTISWENYQKYRMREHIIPVKNELRPIMFYPEEKNQKPAIRYLRVTYSATAQDKNDDNSSLLDLAKKISDDL